MTIMMAWMMMVMEERAMARPVTVEMAVTRREATGEAGVTGRHRSSVYADPRGPLSIPRSIILHAGFSRPGE